MNYLDFFSQPPKMYIFRKNSNKTAFGGVFISYIYYNNDNNFFDIYIRLFLK